MFYLKKGWNVSVSWMENTILYLSHTPVFSLEKNMSPPPPPSLPIPLFMHLFIQDSPLLISAKCVQHPVHYHPYYGLQRRLYYANTSLTKTSSPSYLQSFAFKCRNSDKIKKDVNFIKQNIIILKTLVSFLKANITILCSLKNVQF